MPDLVPRLLEAIGETERKAYDALGLLGNVNDWWEAGPLKERSGMSRGDAAHIAHNDPSSVLRRCTADRDIVEWCTETIGDLDMSRYGEPGLLKDHPQALAVTLAAETLLNLARGYGLEVTE